MVINVLQFFQQIITSNILFSDYIYVRMSYEGENDPIRVKLEIDESGGFVFKHLNIFDYFFKFVNINYMLQIILLMLY